MRVERRRLLGAFALAMLDPSAGSHCTLLELNIWDGQIVEREPCRTGWRGVDVVPDSAGLVKLV